MKQLIILFVIAFAIGLGYQKYQAHQREKEAARFWNGLDNAIGQMEQDYNQQQREYREQRRQQEQGNGWWVGGERQ